MVETFFPAARFLCHTVFEQQYYSIFLILKSLMHYAQTRKTCPIPKWFLGCIAAPGEEAKLDEAERKLESLRTEVVVVANILKLKLEIPRIFNDRMELPQSLVGLDRSRPILEFLQTSNSKELRVIGIHGLAGLGKTTLLNYIWQEASSIAPFAARAHVQIGHNASSYIGSLQSSIMQQLGGGRLEFTSPESGKKRLSEHFQQLRGDKKPIFLAIDNIFDVEDLKNLLPFNMSKDLLPASSSIAVTCRNFGIVKALLNICHLKEENESQVFCFSPSCLNSVDSKAVFAACGDLCTAMDAELLESLVPLCKGLPLALTVLGKLFAGNARRERQEWEAIKEQMEVLDGDDAETMPVTNSLQLSYDQLKESRKAAFLDVVNFFYGWPWERVERILGVTVLKDLKDSSLISEADGWSKCNQSALRTGFDFDWFSMYRMGYESAIKRVVTMHDLTLKFGERLHTLPVTVKTGFQVGRGLLKDLEARKVRNFILWSYPEADSEREFLKEATSLQTLLICKEESVEYIATKEKIFKANFYPNLEVAPYLSTNWPQSLRYLRVQGRETSRLILSAKLTHEIREIHLHNCPDLDQLPDIPLFALEWLSIRDCQRFQGFSGFSVRNWRKLKYLEVLGCSGIASVPAELGHIENLRAVRFERCGSLRTFPSLGKAAGPSHLLIADCRSLQSLPTMSCPLKRLELSIPIAHLALKGTAFLHLEQIHLTGCAFVVLPRSICDAPSVEWLSVTSCYQLKELPPAIGNASSLKTVRLSRCESLVELPDEVGKLTSLTELDIYGCKNLKGLPAGIGNALSLRELRLSQCESLVELPDEVGKLTSLTELGVYGCMNLNRLPAAIGNASSLRTLTISECASLVELPDDVGKLTLLTELDVHGCKNFKGLPSTIGNASSLRTLRVSECENLVELPDEVGKLTLLTKLDMNGCKKLKGLPIAIGNALSLRTLRVTNCESLVELQDEVGKLLSLTELNVSGCKNLKGVSTVIGSLSSLQTLRVANCESLVELPDEVGMLTLLTELDFSYCTSLKGLPPAIGNASSLQTLILRGCSSLAELPDEMGKLTSLTKLDVNNCWRLKRLPPALGSLETLSVWGRSLNESPQKSRAGASTSREDT